MGAKIKEGSLKEFETQNVENQTITRSSTTTSSLTPKDRENIEFKKNLGLTDDNITELNELIHAGAHL